MFLLDNELRKLGLNIRMYNIELLTSHKYVHFCSFTSSYSIISIRFSAVYMAVRGIEVAVTIIPKYLCPQIIASNKLVTSNN